MGPVDPRNNDDEPYIRLRDLPREKWLPRPRGGARRLAASTIFRWRSRGANGVVLKCVRTPGGWVTRKSWVQEFFGELARRHAAPQQPPVVAGAAHARAEAELERAGI